MLFYVALAVAFGIGLWVFAGPVPAGEFFAGYITEYSLSVDNLFVFVIIMAAFKVPAEHQHRVLLVGIGIALVMRGAWSSPSGPRPSTRSAGCSTCSPWCSSSRR